MCLLSASLSAPGYAQTAGSLAPGWKLERSGESVVLTPPGLAAGETFSLTVEPLSELRGADKASWLESRIVREVKTLGTMTDAGKVMPLG
ncbi:MAG: hypothetical protein H7145_13340, partial [Akkermansiaceae bacterium]|nr:hypothetical protein [Armatimonadota bacterium]